MARSADHSSITVAIRVRPFTIREAAQLTRVDNGPVFLGEGSLAAAPPKLTVKGIRNVIKVIDDKCLYVVVVVVAVVVLLRLLWLCWSS